MRQENIEKIKNFVIKNNSYFEISEDDSLDLQVCDGCDDDDNPCGEYHCVCAMREDGVETDEGDLYLYDDLTDEELEMLCDYIDEL